MEYEDNDTVLVYSEMALKRKKNVQPGTLFLCCCCLSGKVERAASLNGPHLVLFRRDVLKWNILVRCCYVTVNQLGFYGKKRPITHCTWFYVGFVLCTNPCHPLGLRRIALKMAICEAPVPAFTDNNCCPSTPGPGAIETFRLWKEPKNGSQLEAIRSEMYTNWRITCDGSQLNEKKVGALSCWL